MRTLAYVVVISLLGSLASGRARADNPPSTWEGANLQPQTPTQTQPPLPAPAPLPPPGSYAPPYGSPYATPYGFNPQTLYLYQSEKVNPGVAVLASLFIPGLGNVYAHNLMGAVVTWALIIGGLALIAHSQTHAGDVYQTNTTDITLGILAVVGGVIYSPIDAGLAASDYNRDLARRLGLPVGLAFSVAPMKVERGVGWGPDLSFRF